MGRPGLDLVVDGVAGGLPLHEELRFGWDTDDVSDREADDGVGADRFSFPDEAISE